jgi:osmoprotectant transport system permease protein
VILANGPDSFIWWEWVGNHTDDIWVRTIEHLQLTGSSVAIGFVIAMAMAVVSLRWRRAYGPLAALSGGLYSIPSLALFGFLVPITGLGFRTAQIALVSYTLLILLRNIVAGIDAVPASVIEAADGMGFEPWRRFLAVDLRLAAPAIVGGLRVATVTVIGLVTVAALVGSGGYGVFIDDGLSRASGFSTPIVVGGALSIAMAVAFDVAFVLLQRLITPWARAARPGAAA